jgi:hypothetical protein
MARLTELLEQITGWIQHYNAEEWAQVQLAPGLSRNQIEQYLDGKAFTFPEEIIELYQWQNGTGYGAFFVSAESGYDEQEFHSLAIGLGYGEEWEQDYCPGTALLGLFAFEGTQYWTVLPESPQELAPIYVSDGPDFDTSSPSYPSLAAMLEKKIPRLKFVWKIDDTGV